jgi:hypothetical protein
MQAEQSIKQHFVAELRITLCLPQISSGEATRLKLLCDQYHSSTESFFKNLPFLPPLKSDAKRGHDCLPEVRWRGVIFLPF